MTTENTQPAVPVTPVPPVVSTEGTTPEAPEAKVETPKPPETPKYVTMEELKQALVEAKEDGRRLGQSQKDKDVRDAIREANRLRKELEGVNTSFAGLDEETKTRLELGRYKAREQAQSQADIEEQQRQAFEATINQFKSNLTDYATEVGVDPSNKGLDFGDDTESLTIRQNKFLKSVAKIQKEKRKTDEDAALTRFKEFEAKTRKELGLDSVDNAPPVVPKNNSVSQAQDDYINGVISYEEARKRGVKFT